MTDAFAMAGEADRSAYEPPAVTACDTPCDTPASPPTSESDSRDSRDSDTAPARLRTSWTAAELLATAFPDPRWAVRDILPEGVTLFAGPPKIGKSWWALGTAVAVASGGKALGHIDVEPGPVLYLALEDTPRRLKARLQTMLGPNPAPPGLVLATACPPLPDRGAEHIANWLDRHPDARLVVIDVFARMRGPTPANTAAYDADYAAVVRAKEIADRYGVALVLVHHVRRPAPTTSSTWYPAHTASPPPPTRYWSSNGHAGRRTRCCTSPAETSWTPNTR